MKRTDHNDRDAAARRKPSRRVADAAGYAAFISYSHDADGQLGPAVERGLERLAKPWYRRRAVNVFRDDTDLAVTHALWSTIVTALDRSEFFVLLASPEAARSQWVAREIDHWKATKSVERILLIVTEGQCHWAAGDFDPERSTAIPPSLFGVFAEEPRWLDLSWAREETQLDLRHSRFRDAIAQLAAPIHGRPKDELEAEDIRQHRRTLRLAWSAMAILLVLTVVASMGWVNAVSNARRADQQRDTAVSRQLSAQSQTDLIDELPRSVLLSLEALHLRATPDARGALLMALQRTPGLLQVVETSPNPIVTAVAWSPSGRQLAWGETNGDIILWDVEHVRRSEPPLRGHSQPVDALAFSPDGQRLASGSWDGSVRVWDLASPSSRQARVMEHGEAVFSVAFSPDGQMLASAGADGKTLLWSVSSQQRVGPVMPGHAVAFSPDGRSVAVASNNQLALWDVGRGEMIESQTSPAKEYIQEIVFDTVGTTLASSSVGDHLVVLWDVRPLRPRGEPLNGYKTLHRGKLGSSASDFPYRQLQLSDRDRHVIAFSHDGTTLVSGGIDDSIVFWDVKKRQLLGYYPTNRHERIYGIAFSPKDDMLATATSKGDVLIWGYRNVRYISSPLNGGHRAEVNAVAFSRDGKTIVSGDSAGTILVWDASEMRAVGEPMVQPGSVTSLSLSPDGSTLVSSGSHVVLWDTVSRKRIATLGKSTGKHGVSFSPDGSIVASANGKTVVLWDVKTRSMVRQFTGHRDDIKTVKFSSDGWTLASGGSDGRILLWDLHAGKKSGELIVRVGFWSLAVSPDGKMLATGTGEIQGDIMLWDVRTGNRVTVLTGHNDAVSDLAFNPDGKMLASASDDGSLFLWDMDNRERMGPLRGHRKVSTTKLPGLVKGIAFNGNGNAMVSVGSDGHVVLWDLRLASWIDWGCKLAARNLSQVEWDRFFPGKSYHRTCRDLPSGAGAPANAPTSMPH